MIKIRLQLVSIALALLAFGALAQDQTPQQPPAGQEQPAQPAQEQPAQPAQPTQEQPAQPVQPAQEQPAQQPAQPAQQPAQQQPAPAQPGQAGQQGQVSADTLFTNAAASSNMFEITASQLALQNAADSRIQQFAQKMIDDHTAAGEQLTQIASNLDLQLPQQLNDADQFSLQYLEQQQGEAFEQRYLEQQLVAHESAVALFRMESESGQEASLRDFATATLPILEGHLEMVRNLLQEVFGTDD